MIIALEGMDASGKATQAKLLAEKLTGAVMAFPQYGTKVGKMIRSHLEGNMTVIPKLYDAAVFQCLQAVNRMEMRECILQLLVANSNIIFDRYYASGYVYGALDGLARSWTESIQPPMPEPDHWILLDVPVAASFERRPNNRDRYERDADYLDKVRLEYLSLFRDRGWAIVDGVGTVDEVHNRIWEVVKP